MTAPTPPSTSTFTPATAPLPTRETVLNAIAIYLQHAYTSEPSRAALQVISTLKSWGGPLLNCPVFVKDNANPPLKAAVRLGNQNYPHCKMIIEQAPDRSSYLFRVDTHDRHCCPPQSNPEHTSFVCLMEKNQELASAIESAWEKNSVDTFKSFLKQDLARRAAKLS